jgi:hypothetical protein
MHFRHSKRHVISRLAELRKLLAQPLDNSTAAAAGAEKLLRVLARTDSTAEGPASRNLVLAAAAPFQAAAAPTGVVDASPVAVSQVLWLAASSGAAFEPRTRAVGWRGVAADRNAVLGAGRALADAIAARRNATYRAAACLVKPPARLLQIEVHSAQAGATCRVSSPDFASVEHETVKCDAEDAATDTYPYGASVLVLVTTLGASCRACP